MKAQDQNNNTFVNGFYLIVIIILSGLYSFGQKNEITTIILTRHAEKNLNEGNDPSLSIAGRIRANKLATLFVNAKPGEMYATPYKRTIETLEPWAKATGLTIKSYNASELAEFAEQLKVMVGKTVVVAGHSNTTPALANLLLNEDKYKQQPDDEYNKIFVITIIKGKAKAKVIEY